MVAVKCEVTVAAHGMDTVRLAAQASRTVFFLQGGSNGNAALNKRSATQPLELISPNDTVSNTALRHLCGHPTLKQPAQLLSKSAVFAAQT